MSVAIDTESHEELKRQLAQCEADGNRMAAEIRRLREPFRAVDDLDWTYLLHEHALGDGGRDRFWKQVLTEMRVALTPKPEETR